MEPVEMLGIGFSPINLHNKKIPTLVKIGTSVGPLGLPSTNAQGRPLDEMLGTGFLPINLLNKKSRPYLRSGLLLAH